MASKLPKSLASITTSAHSMSIFEEGRPLETLLQHLRSCLLRGKMTSIGIFMAVTENPLLFFFRHTPSNDLISIVFE